MPQQLDWQTTIASAAEPGERMEISGIIYQSDGKTPAANVILYVYHTDATVDSIRPPAGATEGARRHGHLRGWMKTNQRGEYKFTSIRPAHYPNSRGPAHIHAIVKEADKNEYWIDEYLFDDDPALQREHHVEARESWRLRRHSPRKEQRRHVGRQKRYCLRTERSQLQMTESTGGLMKPGARTSRPH